MPRSLLPRSNGVLDERRRAKGGLLGGLRRCGEAADASEGPDRAAPRKGEVAPASLVWRPAAILFSGAAKLFVQVDVTNHPALFVRNPGWHLGFDMDPDMATRRTVYEMLLAEQMPRQ
jgi:hypothetical protein